MNNSPTINETFDIVREEREKLLLRQLRAFKADKAKEDLYYFDKEVLGYREMEEQPHRGLCDFVTNPRTRFLLILEPRGCFKTSCTTIGYSIQSIVRNPNIRILIDTEDLSISKTFLREIKAHMESGVEFKKIFGDWVGDKWTETEIIVNQRMKKHLKEPTIALSGVESTKVSQHYDLIICDDLHSQLNIATPEQIEKVKQHFRLLFSLLEPQGKLIVIGTRWHFNDLYSEIIEKEMERRAAGLPQRFRIRRKKAIHEDGTLHFPARLTKEFLEDQKREQGSYIYSCQYQNEPVDQESAKFKKAWIKFYGNNAPSGLTITCTLDPAISKKDDGCYTAITTVGVDMDGYWYILDLTRMKLNPTEVVNAIMNTQEKWKPVRFGIEVVAFQKTLKYWCYERSMETGVFPNFVELKTDTQISKPMRIESLIPYVENGLVQFPGFSEATVPEPLNHLYTEMTQFPVGKYMDALDALAYQVQVIGRPGIPKKPKPREDTIQAIRLRHRNRNQKGGDGLPIIGRGRMRSLKIASSEVIVRG